MKNGHVFLDSFSGLAADLPRGKRTPENVLAALRINPRVSTWDMDEHAWLRDCIDDLRKSNKITDDKGEPYPWHRYIVIEPDANCMRPAKEAIDCAQRASAQEANDE